MNKLVMLIQDDDEVEILKEDRKWHVAHFSGGSPTVLCTSEVYGFGEGRAIAREKTTHRGGITCSECIAHVKKMKSIKL